MEHEEIIKLLVKSGASLNIKNHEGVTPIQWLDHQKTYGLSDDKIAQLKRWVNC